MENMRRQLLGMTIEEMKLFAAELGEKPFRGGQIFAWLHRGVTDFEEMTNLSKALRERLTAGLEAGDFSIGGCRVADVQEDRKDGTRKFLFEMETSDFVEGVFMKYGYGNSLCVSSQVGCRMGCRFCASALGGFVRNLSAGEMLGQVLAAENHVRDEGTDEDPSINHIVVMGMGEPFDNYDNLACFLRLLHDEKGRNMSYRNMTVSTSGIVPKIIEFSKRNVVNSLAVSLHAPNNELRSRLMPINNKYSIEELIDAVRIYVSNGNKKVTFAYIMIRDINDSDECAVQLSSLLKGIKCYVNLIPYNRTSSSSFEKSKKERIAHFFDILKQNGINVTVRREFGGTLNAACGQLSAEHKRKITK